MSTEEAEESQSFTHQEDEGGESQSLTHQEDEGGECSSTKRHDILIFLILLVLTISALGCAIWALTDELTRGKELKDKLDTALLKLEKTEVFTDYQLQVKLNNETKQCLSEMKLDQPNIKLAMEDASPRHLKGRKTLNLVRRIADESSKCGIKTFEVNDDGTIRVKYPGRYYVHSQVPFICTGEPSTHESENEHTITYYGRDIGRTLPLSISNFKRCDADTHVHVSTHGGVYQIEPNSLLSVQIIHDDGMTVFRNDTMEPLLTLKYLEYDKYII